VVGYMNDELVRTWKGEIVGLLRYYSIIFLKGLQKLKEPQRVEVVSRPRYEPRTYRIQV
jgi:hypothetical protein